MEELRIVLGHLDFEELINGKEVSKETDTVNVKIILSDMGFGLMHDLLNDAIGEEENVALIDKVEPSATPLLEAVHQRNIATIEKMKSVKSETSDDIGTEETSDIYPCPFCGSDDVFVTHNQDQYENPDKSYVECNSCCAEGPHEDKEEIAILNWDKVANRH